MSKNVEVRIGFVASFFGWGRKLRYWNRLTGVTEGYVRTPKSPYILTVVRLKKGPVIKVPSKFLKKPPFSI